jgi:hypothetical protein
VNKTGWLALVVADTTLIFVEVVAIEAEVDEVANPDVIA